MRLQPLGCVFDTGVAVKHRKSEWPINLDLYHLCVVMPDLTMQYISQSGNICSDWGKYIYEALGEILLKWLNGYGFG